MCSTTFVINRWCRRCCSEQSKQSGVPAQKVHQAAGTFRRGVRADPISRHAHDQALPRAARSTIRLRLQTRQICPAAGKPTSRFCHAICVYLCLLGSGCPSVRLEKFRAIQSWASIHTPRQRWSNLLPLISPSAPPPFNGDRVWPRGKFRIKDARRWVLQHFRHKHQHIFDSLMHLFSHETKR